MEEEKVRLPVYGECRVVEVDGKPRVELVDEVDLVLEEDENDEQIKRLVPLIKDWKSVYLPNNTLAIVQLPEPLEDRDEFVFKFSDTFAELYRIGNVTISGMKVAYCEFYASSLNKDMRMRLRIPDKHLDGRYRMVVPAHRLVLAYNLLDLIENGSTYTDSMAPFELIYFVPLRCGPLMVSKDSFEYLVMIDGDLEKLP